MREEKERRGGAGRLRFVQGGAGKKKRERGGRKAGWGQRLNGPIWATTYFLFAVREKRGGKGDCGTRLRGKRGGKPGGGDRISSVMAGKTGRRDR